MRWKRLPRAVSTSRPVDPVASATSSMVSVEPINVAISPLHAALASGRSVTSMASRSNDEGAVTGQRYPPTIAYSLVLGSHDRGKPSAWPIETNARRRRFGSASMKLCPGVKRHYQHSAQR